jgi:hypothetical protein
MTEEDLDFHSKQDILSIISVIDENPDWFARSTDAEEFAHRSTVPESYRDQLEDYKGSLQGETSYEHRDSGISLYIYGNSIDEPAVHGSMLQNLGTFDIVGDVDLESELRETYDSFVENADTDRVSPSEDSQVLHFSIPADYDTEQVEHVFNEVFDIAEQVDQMHNELVEVTQKYRR